MTDGLPLPVRSSLLQGLGHSIVHGFFTRHGGVSQGVYQSLNAGYGSSDAPERITENRARMMQALHAEEGALALVTLHQVHSARAVAITAMPDLPVEADGMATTLPGIALGVLTADCAPVLFADVVRGVIGAAHAGWRGAVGGVVEATLVQMEKLGARREDVVAAVGPCIAAHSYEVGEDVYRAVQASEVADAQVFVAGADGVAGTYYFDLRGYVRTRLKAAGITQVDILPHDTYAQAEDFFSYRRACHLGEPDYGRQLSVIALPSVLP